MSAYIYIPEKWSYWNRGLSYTCTYGIPLTIHQWLAQTTLPLILMSKY